MTRHIHTLPIIAFLLLGACATTETPPPAARPGPAPAPAAPAGSAAFRASDFAWSSASGSGAIQGQVTYKQKKVAFSCSNVVLTPETPWVRQRMNVLYRSTESAALPADEVRKRTPPERSQDYSNFVKRTTCDAAGHFSFTGLPDGAWFVITVVKPVNGAAGVDVAIMRRVHVQGGRSVSVRL